MREGTTCIQRGNANVMMGISGYRANANPHELRPCIRNVGKYIPYMDALGMEMVPFEPWLKYTTLTNHPQVSQLGTPEPRIKPSCFPLSPGCFKGILIMVNYNPHLTMLVGGFNPLEKYVSNWKSSPTFGVQIKNIRNHHPVFHCV